jgi:hypothetical protein
MDVKFSNCTVPVWKLKYGTVVAVEVNEHTDYCHVQNIQCRKDGTTLITLSMGRGIIKIPSESLIWLEPF